MKEKERERLGDRRITQIERRLLLRLEFGVWRFLLPSIHNQLQDGEEAAQRG